jgi:hypothetical protein
LGGRIDRLDPRQAIGEAVAPRELRVDRDQAASEDHHRDVGAEGRGEEQPGLGHADDRHREELARGPEPAVHRHGQQHRVERLGLGREQVE